MTPAQQRALAVALDGLREAFGDEARAAIVRGLYDAATAERMLLVGRRDVDAALARILSAAQDAWGLEFTDREHTCPGCGMYGGARHTEDCLALSDFALVSFKGLLLSPPETPTATLAHRPTAESQAPSGDKHVCGATYGVRCDACGAAP